MEESTSSNECLTNGGFLKSIRKSVWRWLALVTDGNRKIVGRLGDAELIETVVVASTLGIIVWRQKVY